MLNLLQPEVERITPTEHKPTHDHAPEELALGTPLWLRDDLVELLGGEQVHSRLIDLVKYASAAVLVFTADSATTEIPTPDAISEISVVMSPANSNTSGITPARLRIPKTKS